jgi:D-alanine-D-alanine ligase
MISSGLAASNRYPATHPKNLLLETSNLEPTTMRVAVLVNLKDNAPRWEGMPEDRWDDLDSPRAPLAICEVLRKRGHTAELFEASILPPFNLIEQLQAFKPDICFNLSESHFGDGREAQIPAVLEMLRIPYTGSGVLSLAVALDKTLTKRVLRDYGLPTAEFQLFNRPDDSISPAFLNGGDIFRFPLFVKPNAEGTSMGVTEKSVVHTVAELREELHAQFARYEQPILVERFIKGREVLVGMVGNPTPTGDVTDGLTFVPILEVDFPAFGENHIGFYTSEMKTVLSPDNYYYHCPAHLTEEQATAIRRAAAAAFRAINCRDVARVDIRLDETRNDEPIILEINTLPGLSPNYSDLCLQALAMGWEHEHLVGAIFEAAVKRCGLTE